MSKHDKDAWWEDRSLPQKVFMGIGFAILGAGFLFLIGLVTMALWNRLMPEIFGLTRITYWQTWGLLMLSFIFFKNWGSGENSGRKDRKRKRHMRRYMSEDASGASPDPSETDAASDAGAAGPGVTDPAPEQS